LQDCVNREFDEATGDELVSCCPAKERVGTDTTLSLVVVVGK
jgi:hypothetical protein